MELRDYIESAARKQGGMKALADFLGLAQQHVSNAKSHQRGLPNDACAKLAKLLGVPEIEVIAASELATEKKPEKRAFWLPFVEHAKAAAFVLTLASVTSFATPSPAEAGEYVMTSGNTLYYVKSESDKESKDGRTGSASK